MMTAEALPRVDLGPLHLYAIAPLRRLPDEVRSLAPAVGGRIDLIQGDRVAAVVGSAPPQDVRQRTRQELMPLLRAYRRINEGIMAVAPVLPVKFGTVAPDWKSVQQCLLHGREAFLEAFTYLEGKTQFEISVTWDPAAIFREIAAMPAIAQAKAALLASGGPITPEARAGFGRQVKHAFDERRADLARRLAEPLTAVAVDSVVTPLLDDSTVLHLGVLVEAGRADALDRCLERLDSAHGGRLTFRCVGPLPPHGFATVDITFLEEAEIARARAVLGLDTVRSAAAVRAAYRRLAKQIHPDVAGAGPDAGTAMAEVHEAYRLLLAHAEGRGSVIVSVSRQDSAPAGGRPATVE